MECNCAEKVLEGHRLIHYLCPLHKAAPDLYEALEAITKQFNMVGLKYKDDKEIIAKADKALAKVDNPLAL